MKQILFFLVLLVPQVLFSQGNWSSNSSRSNNDMQPVGLLVSGGGTFIGGRAGLNTIAEGDFLAGIFLGRASWSVVVLAGVHSQSEIVNYQATQMAYDPSCGCYPQETNIKDFQNYLKIGYFQGGIAFQEKGKSLYVAGGFASVSRSIPTVVDTLGTISMVPLQRFVSPSLSVSGRFRFGRDLFTIDGIAITKQDPFGDIFGKASVSYLLGFNSQCNGTMLYGGLEGGFVQHAVSGKEFLFGPKFLLGSGQELPMDMSISFGASYNPHPEEGLGFYGNFSMAVNRQYKQVYR